MTILPENGQIQIGGNSSRKWTIRRKVHKLDKWNMLFVRVYPIFNLDNLDKPYFLLRSVRVNKIIRIIESRENAFIRVIRVGTVKVQKLDNSPATSTMAENNRNSYCPKTCRIGAMVDCRILRETGLNALVQPKSVKEGPIAIHSMALRPHHSPATPRSHAILYLCSHQTHKRNTAPVRSSNLWTLTMIAALLYFAYCPIYGL